MATQRKNMMFLMLSNNYIGTTVHFEDEDSKVIKDILDYDSLTHVFTVEFENNDIQQISDKLRYLIELPDSVKNNKIKIKPNKKRAKATKYNKKW